METELDVRSVQAAESFARVLRALESLKAGEDFVLVADGDPSPVLARLQSDRADHFDWWPLERGPQTWRIAIARRRPEPRTIHEFLQTDHERLDALIHRALESRDEETLRLFRQFRLGLERHIRIEESMLFPVFEERTGMTGGGPTAVMRMEHARIQELLKNIEERLKARVSAKDLAAALFEVLGAHNAKEEHVLYPMCDQVVTAAEKPGFIAGMQAL